VSTHAPNKTSGDNHIIGVKLKSIHPMRMCTTTTICYGKLEVIRKGIMIPMYLVLNHEPAIIWLIVERNILHEVCGWCNTLLIDVVAI
jgi:hypothetical protein